MPFKEIEDFCEGCDAFRVGLPRNQNPHKRWSAAWVAWLAGWDQSAELDAAELREPVRIS
jgi:hypothetical protein